MGLESSIPEARAAASRQLASKRALRSANSLSCSWKSEGVDCCTSCCKAGWKAMSGLRRYMARGSSCNGLGEAAPAAAAEAGRKGRKGEGEAVESDGVGEEPAESVDVLRGEGDRDEVDAPEEEAREAALNADTEAVCSGEGNG